MKWFALAIGLTVSTAACSDDVSEGEFVTLPQAEEVCFYEVRADREWWAQSNGQFTDAMLALIRQSQGNPLIGVPFGRDNVLYFAFECSQRVLDTFEGLPVQQEAIEREEFMEHFTRWHNSTL